MPQCVLEALFAYFLKVLALKKTTFSIVTIFARYIKKVDEKVEQRFSWLFDFNLKNHGIGKAKISNSFFEFQTEKGKLTSLHE